MAKLGTENPKEYQRFEGFKVAYGREIAPEEDIEVEH